MIVVLNQDLAPQTTRLLLPLLYVFCGLGSRYVSVLVSPQSREMFCFLRGHMPGPWVQEAGKERIGVWRLDLPLFSTSAPLYQKRLSVVLLRNRLVILEILTSLVSSSSPSSSSSSSHTPPPPHVLPPPLPSFSLISGGGA